MEITRITEVLKASKIQADENSIQQALSTVNLSAEQITGEPMLNQLITDGIFGKPTKSRGKKSTLATQEQTPITQPQADSPVETTAIAKSETNDMAQQPPVEQGESVDEIKIEIPAQAIASVENMAVGMVLQIDSEVDAMATSVARLANNAGALFAYKLNQKIGMQSGVNEAESLARHGDAWSASRSRINDLISNIQQGAIAS